MCPNAAAVIAVGACAWDGGLVKSNPNPTGALGLQEPAPGIKVVNLGWCPHNPVDTAALLVHWLTFNEMRGLDHYHHQKRFEAWNSFQNRQSRRQAVATAR